MNHTVREYGAAGDGRTDDRAAIQAAIDAVCASGGGRVTLESGHTYYSSSLILKENVDLHVEKGARLLASADLSTYVHPNDGQRDAGVDRVGTPVTLKPSYAFLYAKDAAHVTISGEGVIDGNCYAFVKRVSPYYVTGDFYPRPTLIYAEHCDHLTVKDITLTNAPFWTLHPAGCDDVLISRIRILNPLDVANSDGIDPDHSKNVRILGCHIECADDAICLKSSSGNMEYGPTENVVIADCTLVSTSAALKIGTEGTGDFRNITVHDCHISRSNRGISIQIRDGGNVEHVFFTNIFIDTRRFADCWWGTAEPITISSHDRDQETHSGTIRDIRFAHIRCDSENGVFFSGSPEKKIKDVVLEDVSVTLRTKSRWPKGQYDLRPGYGKGIEECKSAGFMVRDVDGLRFTDCQVAFADDGGGKFGEPCVLQDSLRVRGEVL